MAPLLIWFHVFCEEKRLLIFLIKEPLLSSGIFLTSPYRRKSILYLQKARLMVRYVSGDACKSRIFQAKLQILSFSQGWSSGGKKCTNFVAPLCNVSNETLKISLWNCRIIYKFNIICGICSCSLPLNFSYDSTEILWRDVITALVKTYL